MNKLALIFLLAAVSAHAEDARQIVQEAQNRARSSSERYEGTLRVVDAKKKNTEKRWIFERVGTFGDSKAVLRFIAPPEVKGVALLILNHKDRASDQWMWIPAVARERRIDIHDRSSRFFGTDFSFEDLEERDVDQFDYKLIGDETLDGAPCWKLESHPRQRKSSQYTSSNVWIRKDNYTFAKIDNYKRDKIVRQITYSDVANIQGVWTARKTDVYDAGRKSHTILTLEKLQYNLPLKQENFTLEALRRES
jgi:hypothetical protein